MPTAFVILEHSGHGPTHWDMMFQQPDALATWQFAANPCAVGEPFPPAGLPARKIQDHRLDYLAYEGSVSRGRGQVRRIESGTYELLAADENHWQIILAGQSLHGLFDLRRLHDDQWTLVAARHRS